MIFKTCSVLTAGGYATHLCSMANTYDLAVEMAWISDFYLRRNTIDKPLG
jgi:hypothetical protein